MSASFPIKLPYTPDKFVDREEALRLVLNKARRMATGETVPGRVVFFLGQRGSGKTWILHEIRHRLKDLEYSLFQCCLITLDQGDSIEVVNDQIPIHRPLVLLLDDVSEIDGSWLDQLEEQVLAPLAQDSRVLLVLTQRGRPHVWTGPEFKDKSETFTLQPFQRQHLKEQVEQQVAPPAVSLDEIERLSGGYPWSTYILATSLPQPTALDDCVFLFLQDVDDDLYPYFEALSILKAFDETRMAPLCQAFSPALAAATRDYAGRRKVREGLVATTLARWDRDFRGYILDEPLRLVLEARLLERAPALWLQLHCVAYRLYDKWAREYPQSAVWWAQEKKYHAGRMNQANFDPARCLEEEKEEGDDNAG